MKMSPKAKLAFKKNAVPLIIGLVIIIISLSGLLSILDNAVYDLFFRLRGSRVPDDRIVIIAIDERSIDRIGPLPWSRSIHAELLQRVTSARVVAFDLLFDLSNDDLGDQAFSQSIQSRENIILASMFTFEMGENEEWLLRLIKPHAILLHQAAGTGFINVPVERGNIIRRITVADTHYGDSPYPSFSLAVALNYLDVDQESIIISNRELTANDTSIPLNSMNQSLIYYWGPGGTFPTYSYIDVLTHNLPANTWDDKIVLIGVTTPIMMDYFENPFTRDNLILTGALPSPGVEVHASAISTYLNSLSFRETAWLENLVLMVILLIISVVLSKRLIAFHAVISGLILGSAVFLFCYLNWYYMHIWFNLASPLFMISMVYAYVLIEKFVQSETDRRWIKDTFTRYLSEEYVNQLIENREQIKLGGVRSEVTILFADLRNYTRYSEDKAPERVIARLNEYFTAMTNVLFEYGGTLDKFLGDGFMAIFGAPLSNSNHAVDALQAVLAMFERLEELNELWNTRGETQLQMGVGINSGTVIVGNIGSEKRMDYTAIGKDVNLAAKLESLNKVHETNIIISERTYELIKDYPLPAGYIYKNLGRVKMVGFQDKKNIYTITHEPGGL